jgi:hypothetical protein
MTSADRDGWSFATAREPARFAAARQPLSPDVEHAIGGDETLCGIPGEQVDVYRHLFRPDGESACARCQEKAAAAPTERCAGERLHDLALTAAEGPMRDELIDALRQGADITLWINGPAASLAKHYAMLDQIVEGREPVVAALRTNDSIGLARVIHGSWQFIVVLPSKGRPNIARATADH